MAAGADQSCAAKCDRAYLCLIFGKPPLHDQQQLKDFDATISLSDLQRRNSASSAADCSQTRDHSLMHTAEWVQNTPWTSQHQLSAHHCDAVQLACNTVACLQIPKPSQQANAQAACSSGSSAKDSNLTHKDTQLVCASQAITHLASGKAAVTLATAAALVVGDSKRPQLPLMLMTVWPHQLASFRCLCHGHMQARCWTGMCM